MNRSTTCLGLLLGLMAELPVASGGEDQGPAGSGQAAVARADEAFGFDLYARLRVREGNLVFSPQSLAAGLALAHAGAGGETARQMATVLHLPNGRPAAPAPPPRKPEPEGEAESCQLRSAHALWGQEGIRFREEYARTLQDRLGASLHEVDFLEDAPGACRAINSWAKEQTRGKVKCLLQPALVTPRTRLVLTDALYFKGSWAVPFRKAMTREEPFHLGKGGTAVIPFMHQTGHFPYLAQDGLQILELPYHGGDLAMVVLMPRSAGGLAGLEKGLSARQLTEWVARLRPQQVEVAFPRFQILADLELKPALSALGMSLAFNEAQADFSGMREGGEPLHLSEVVHKAFVDVNEEGTEAVAATGTTFRARSLQADRHVFRADHAFVFLIRDQHSGQLLVIGRFTGPSLGPTEPYPGGKEGKSGVQ